MKAIHLLVKTRVSETPDGDARDCRRRRGGDWPLRLALVALCLAVTGCQTFTYTDEDLARERRKLAESWASGGWRGWGCGVSGMNISPNLGNIGCPGLGGGAVCPGK